ncbi:type II secretion system minor pseudopilin [Oryzibacter oryziterrae]|uniref:general secretion pathway protein GspK n=1 Tax=Oryzibacter oryziterrae TaxID=2766474 RepID=UPI001F342DE3|nr:type II secretion system protein GspK [Oryzibacter oryziterrae]
MRQIRRRDGGYILVSVLVVMALLAALMAATLSLGRVNAGAAIDEVARLKADALTEAGLELAAFELFDRSLDPHGVNGQQVRFDGGTVVLFVRSPAGRIDLNAAEPEMLAALYRLIGGKALSPDAFAARVVDWRDADGDTGKGGAEAADYASMKLAWRPDDREFQSVDDLKALAGLPADEFQRILPYVTVFNPGGKLDVLEAPAEVLRLASGLRPAQVEQLVRLRSKPNEANLAAIDELVGGDNKSLAVAVRNIFEVTLEVHPATGPVRRDVVIVGRDRSGNRPFLRLG